MIDHLHSLLRAELSAVSGYQRALAVLRKKAAVDAEDLQKFATEHQRTAAILQESIQARGGVPANVWDGPDGAAGRDGDHLGSREFVTALLGTERLLLAAYEERGAPLDDDARELVETELIPRQRRHVAALAARLALLPG